LGRQLALLSTSWRSHVDAEFRSVGQPRGLRRLLAYHMREHPAFGGADLYKLLHQACLGSAHLGRSAHSFHELLKEWEGIVPSSGPLLEPICPRGLMVRLNLRPLKRAGGSVLTVWRAMVASPVEYGGGRERFLRLLAASQALSRHGNLALSPASIADQMARAKQTHCAPCSHSERYVLLERPSYRVFPQGLVEEEGWQELFPTAEPGTG
jgi:hypothetical protein